MHELSIAMSIIDIAAEEAERRGAVAVKAVYLQLGPLSGVVREALCSAFELAREQTPLAASELVIEETPVVFFCPTCRSRQTPASVQELRCPRCDTLCGDLVSGRELELVALEIEP